MFLGLDELRAVQALSMCLLNCLIRADIALNVVTSRLWQTGAFVNLKQWLKFQGKK
jgi:hypothetical protein